MDRAQPTPQVRNAPGPMITADHLRCDSCGGSIDLEGYGDATFCRECRDQAEPFYRKDLYLELGGGD